MEHAKPLPSYLVTRYLGWRATEFSENKSWYKHLANEGQRPRAMVISCCDSRVHVTSIFGADAGEFFIHRNIANLVPPFEGNSDHHGTSAAIEYAVTTLKVAHILVLGHSSCGGVHACHNMCRGRAPELEAKDSFVGRWMDILRPGFARVSKIQDDAERETALEQQSVIVSLENLMSFPMVQNAVAGETLSLHGLWHDIGHGNLMVLDGERRKFVALADHANA